MLLHVIVYWTYLNMSINNTKYNNQRFCLFFIFLLGHLFFLISKSIWYFCWKSLDLDRSVCGICVSSRASTSPWSRPFPRPRPSSPSTARRKSTARETRLAPAAATPSRRRRSLAGHVTAGGGGTRTVARVTSKIRPASARTIETQVSKNVTDEVKMVSAKTLLTLSALNSWSPRYISYHWKPV